MGMIKCPECGNSVSDSANSCPNCGYDFKDARETKEHVYGCLILIAIIIVFSVFGKCGDSSDSKSGDKGKTEQTENAKIPSFLEVGEKTTYTVVLGESTLTYEITLYKDKSAEIKNKDYEDWGKPAVRTEWDYHISEGSYQNKAYKDYYIKTNADGIWFYIAGDGKVYNSDGIQMGKATKK